MEEERAVVQARLLLPAGAARLLPAAVAALVAVSAAASTNITVRCRGRVCRQVPISTERAQSYPRSIIAGIEDVEINTST